MDPKTGKEHSWQDAMKIELQFEGGKDDDPVDPGGRTNQGVIQREYGAYRRRKGLPARDVFLMEPAERDEIYWEGYGKVVRFDELPPGVDVVLVDGAINSGPSQSIKWLQRALGIAPDGRMGNVTMEAVASYPDYDVLVAKILQYREAFLRALKTFWHFGKGWMSRVTQLKRIGQAWASGSVGPPVIWENNMNKKATIIDAKTQLSTAPADATAAGGTVTTALTTAQQTLAPLQGTSHVLDQLIIGLIVMGGLLTAFGLAYAYYARNRNKTLQEDLGLTIPIGANDNDMVPAEVKSQYADPNARGSETGNIAEGVITTSGRTAGDEEVRVNSPSPIPASKAA